MFKTYYENLNKSLSSVDLDILEKIFEVLKAKIIKNGFNIFCGNGGSYANSSHIVGDYQKTFSNYDSIFNCIGDNYASLSAVSNDIAYEEAVQILLKPYLNQDLPINIFFLSGSGNSINLVKAAELVNMVKQTKKGIHSISITAYGGGKLSELCDYPLRFDIKDMEIAEDIQIVIFHYLKQKLIRQFKLKTSNNSKYDLRINNSIII